MVGTPEIVVLHDIEGLYAPLAVGMAEEVEGADELRMGREMWERRVRMEVLEVLQELKSKAHILEKVK